MKKLISSVVVAGAVMGGNAYAVDLIPVTVPSTTALRLSGYKANGTDGQPIVTGIKASSNSGANTDSGYFPQNYADRNLTTQGYVDQQVDGVQTQVTNLNTRVDGLQNRVSEVERNSYAGIAGVAAISQIQVAPGKDFAIGVGVGTYRGQSTAAVGAAARINENLHFRAGFSGSGVAAAGLTFSW